MLLRFYNVSSVGNHQNERLIFNHGFMLVFRDLKVIIMGSAHIGKTCFINRYIEGQYKESVTVGILLLC